MLEKECIQLRGFKNCSEGQTVSGFQVAFRSMYYRGIWLSQLRPATVIVDGESFSGNQVTWTIGGRVYEQTEFAAHSDIHWSLLEPAILTVSRPGGLSQGYHDIEIKYSFSSSYLPPMMDEIMVNWMPPMTRRMLLV